MTARVAAVIALVILTVIWGYGWIVVKIALQYADPFTFAAVRTSIGTLLLCAIVMALGRRIERDRYGETLVLGLIQTGAFIGLTTWALTAGGAGKTAVLIFTMPFWTLLFARLMLGERIDALQWLVMALAAAGLVLVMEPWVARGTVLSELLAVAAGAVWGLAAVLTKRMQRRASIDPLALAATQLVFGLAPLVLIAMLTPSRPIAWTPEFILALAYSAVLTTALGWALWVYALQHVPAGVAGLSSLANPVLAVLFAWLQLGERPNTSELSGMLAIVGALALLSQRALRRHRDEVPAPGPE